MMNLRNFLATAFFLFCAGIIFAQGLTTGQMMNAYSGLAVPSVFTIGNQPDATLAASDEFNEDLPYSNNLFGEVETEESSEDFLPYAEPLFGMEAGDYKEHFEANREGALMDRVLDLHEMELQAVYADSKMNEINLSFNSFVEQELVLNVYNELGQKVMSEVRVAKDGYNNYAIRTNVLTSGFYSMVVSGRADQFIQRFIIE